MPDHNGYPTLPEMKALLSFEGSPAHFVDYINGIWWHDGFTVKNGRDIFNKGCKKLYLSTWGWSGNEDLIEEMRKTFFWMLYWQSSNRGGHYEFRVPLDRWDDLSFPIGAILDTDKPTT